MPKIKIGRTPEAEAYIGQRVREARLRAGISQEKLAEAIGITFQQIQKYEGGVNRIAASTLCMIAAKLGVNVMSLLPEPSESDTASDLPRLTDGQIATGMKVAIMLSRLPDKISKSIIRHISALANQSPDIDAAD